MTIAIDFDKTWTEDPELWRQFAADALQRGHKVVMATGRESGSQNSDMGRYGITIPIVFCGGVAKRKACAAAGWKVDCWIDDMPEMIGETLIIGNDEEL